MNITIDSTTRYILGRLAESWGLSESATIRLLINKAFIDESRVTKNATTQPPVRDSSND